MKYQLALSLPEINNAMYIGLLETSKEVIEKLQIQIPSLIVVEVIT